MSAEETIRKALGELKIDEILKMSNSDGSRMSSSELEAAIGKLQEWQSRAAHREREEKKRLAREEAEQKKREKEAREAAHIEKVTSMELPIGWDNIFDSDPRAEGVHADSVSDGLILSLSNLGRVDIEYISSVTGSGYKEVIEALRGSIYQNPQTWGECFYKGWETAEEYLSSNLSAKWQAAKDANTKYRGYFAENLRALEAVMPGEVAAKDIYVTLGSPWVPTDVIDDFIKHIYGIDHDIHETFSVRHDLLTGTWEIPSKSSYSLNVSGTFTYGTRRLPAVNIIEKTLNMRPISVNDEVYDPTTKSGVRSVVNKDETLLAIEKQKLLIDEFQRWVWTDKKRADRLREIYARNFTSMRRRVFDGSFLKFPTMNNAVTLYPYQKNAVARILFTPNTLLAHEVGSGKTYVMIAAGMEMRRMGLSKKNLYVVPNNIVGQWEKIFREMYPKSKLLVVDPKRFAPHKRIDTLEDMRDGDFDAIIIAYSCFDMIPMSDKSLLAELEVALEELKANLSDRTKATSGLRTRVKKTSEKIAELTLKVSDISSQLEATKEQIFFDDLGVTRLFVDEAHNYKNLPLETKNPSVLGINAKGSKKCKDMMDKVCFVEKEGGGVILATGTPVTNSVTDAFVIQKYLQNGELGLLGISNFDGWAGMFAQQAQAFEIDVDTSSYRLATRFSKFHNLPELTALFSQIADFHKLDKQNGIPDLDGYTDALIPKTPEFTAFLSDISRRADDVRAHNVSRATDNMLKITTDGRKGALDMRLVDPNAQFDYRSKVSRCAENVASIWATTNGSQLVFCDTSTPKSAFNVYDEIRRLLVGYGIPDGEIAYVHDAETETKRQKLFADVRSGAVRILIGSTFKIGIGVNVQDKLIALHHLDVPWRPADMTQREGRIIRQGNENEKVRIFRYITDGSFDAYSWQLLETKQRFITALLSGSYTGRDGGEIDDTVLDYAEVKALAVGDPLIKERVETANELERTITLHQKEVDERLRLENELSALPAQIEAQKRDIERAKTDLAAYTRRMASLPQPQSTAEKEEYAKKRRELRERIYAAISDNAQKSEETRVARYHGFDVVLPAHMMSEKPYLWLVREGKYFVDLGEKERGVLARIDNFLDALPKHIEKLGETLAFFEKRETQIKEELKKIVSYSDRIEELGEKLRKIDKKLNVGN